jgi:hypothetical protein
MLEAKVSHHHEQKEHQYTNIDENHSRKIAFSGTRKIGSTPKVAFFGMGHINFKGNVSQLTLLMD